jgi:integrase
MKKRAMVIVQIEERATTFDDAFETYNSRIAFGIVRRLTELTTKAKQDRVNKPIRSLATREAVFSSLKTFGRFLEVNHAGSLKSFPLEIIDVYLRARRERVSPSQLKKDEYAMRIAFGYKRTGVIHVPKPTNPRAYSKSQVDLIRSAQTVPHWIGTDLAYAAGLRACELLTIARLREQPPSERKWPAEMHFGKVSGDLYTVIGKGGLIRPVHFPTHLAERLEATRRPTPVVVRNAKLNKVSRYDIVGGKRWSDSFSRSCKRVFGCSAGGHGVRHSYAMNRFKTLCTMGFADRLARRVISAELGHFRPGIVETYLRGWWDGITSAT